MNFKKGDLPIIISVPHGGNLECNNLPKRKKGILGIDKGTVELANELISIIKNLSKTLFIDQMEPSFIILNVPRRKIDINRPPTEAFPKNSELAKKIYDFYHSKLSELINFNISAFSKSILIDIHGFEKSKRPPGFREVELILGTRNLKSLYYNEVPKKDWGENIRGKIIKRFLENGIPIAPGHPRRKEYVLTGGYIIQKYGSAQIAQSQAIQIEFSDTIRIYDKEMRTIVLKTIADVILKEIL
ncbi:MAG: hypothetical protein ACTSQJ_14925 [Promethearchaeota archaeon]